MTTENLFPPGVLRAGWQAAVQIYIEYSLPLEAEVIDEWDELISINLTDEVQFTSIENYRVSNVDWGYERRFIDYEALICMAFAAVDIEDVKKQAWERFNNLQFKFESPFNDLEIKLDDVTYWAFYDLFDANSKYQPTEINIDPEYALMDTEYVLLGCKPIAFYYEGPSEEYEPDSFSEVMTGKAKDWEFSKDYKIVCK